MCWLQISDVLFDAGKPSGVKLVCIYGGTSKGPQISSLKSGVVRFVSFTPIISLFDCWLDIRCFHKSHTFPLYLLFAKTISFAELHFVHIKVVLKFMVKLFLLPSSVLDFKICDSYHKTILHSLWKENIRFPDDNTEVEVNIVEDWFNPSWFDVVHEYHYFGGLIE